MALFYIVTSKYLHSDVNFLRENALTGNPSILLYGCDVWGFNNTDALEKGTYDFVIEYIKCNWQRMGIGNNGSRYIGHTVEFCFYTHTM